MKHYPIGPVNAAHRIPTNPSHESQLRGEKHAGARTALQMPRPSAYPPRFKQYDRGINDRVNGFKLMVQRPPYMSSRGIQEPNDHSRAYLYRGQPQPHTSAHPPQNGSKRDSLLYDKGHREGRLYAKRLNPTPNYVPSQVK